MNNKNKKLYTSIEFIDNNKVLIFKLIIFAIGLAIIIPLVLNKIRDNENAFNENNVEINDIFNNEYENGELVKVDILRKDKDALILNKLIDLNNIKNNKDYFDDYNFKFVYFVNHANEYISIDETDRDGNTVTGLRRFKVNDFDYFYLRLMGESFDINNLSEDNFPNVSEFPVINDGYLYTSVSSDSSINLVSFDKTLRYSDGFFVDIFKIYETTDTTKDENKLKGKIYVKYNVDPKGFTIYKSIIIRK